ncbi:serine O-acetyltransferase [Agarivorans gilvus]|uniref:Serine acetyltransferase n=1 Tax=Agarivorans gilvus TaxID=680279 RepID=A0ABQ1I3A3_9ALTE|nr:hypothetical protein [Agarivorans gilvus]GGB12398.1 serine acetyltransferase [Agarivorans gilvus]
MIKNKNELNYFLAADKFALGIKKKRPGITDEIWKFQIALRHVEYYKNIKPSILNKIKLRIFQIKKHRLALKLGFHIPSNVFGPGLRINHYGNIIVNGAAKVGMWCDIHQGVNIGSNNSENGDTLVPQIGDNVWIGPGAKLFGAITVGNEVQIAANAVVNKDIINNSTVAGIPSKIIKNTGTEAICVSANKSKTKEFFKLHPEYNIYLKK